MMVGGYPNGKNVKMYTLRDGQFIPDCPKNRQQLPIDIFFGSGAALEKGNLTNKKYNKGFTIRTTTGCPKISVSTLSAYKSDIGC